MSLKIKMEKNKTWEDRFDDMTRHEVWAIKSFIRDELERQGKEILKQLEEQKYDHHGGLIDAVVVDWDDIEQIL